MIKELNKIISYYLPVEEFIKQYAKTFKQLQTGQIKEQEFFKELLKKYKLPQRSIKRITEQHDSKRNQLITLNKDIKSVLTSLKNDYKIGLISNMPKEWFIKDIERLGLKTNNFKTMTFSNEERITKPDKKIFIKACKELKEQPERCAYITNHEQEAITAKNTGMITITINNNEGDYNIKELNELTTLFTKENNKNKQVHEVN